MTPNPHMYSTNQPWLHLVDSNHSQFADFLWATERDAPSSIDGQAVIRLLRGAKMRSYQGLYDEFAAALQFPYYFGENMAAFDECLSDLEWLSGSCFILAISDADLLLDQEDREALPHLIGRLAELAGEWNEPASDVGEYLRDPTPFHVLFHVTPARRNTLSQRASWSGSVISEVKIR